MKRNPKKMTEAELHQRAGWVHDPAVAGAAKAEIERRQRGWHWKLAIFIPVASAVAVALVTFSLSG